MKNNPFFIFIRFISIASLLLSLLLSAPSTSTAFASPTDLTPPTGSTYKDIRDFIKSIAVKHPTNAKIFTLGTSDLGVPIEGLEVGEGPVNQLVVATHHGNEYGSTEVAKAFAADLAANPLKGQKIFIIPVLNTSGYDSKSRHEKGRGGQTYDPNRDYPGPCGTSGPFKLKSTHALAQFLDSHQIISSATLHTYSPAVVYPWGFSTHDLSTPYDDLFKMLGQAATVESKYAVGNSTELIYPADGTFEDYAFWKHGTWSMLFELGYSHYPNSEALKELVRVNVPGLRRMFSQMPLQRAENHAFTGKCDVRLKALDRHDE